MHGLPIKIFEDRIFFQMAIFSTCAQLYINGMSNVFILNSRKVSQLCLIKHLSLYRKQPCLDWARLLSMAGSALMGKKTKAGFEVTVGNSTLPCLTSKGPVFGKDLLE